MPTSVSINGVPCEPGSARVSVFDRGFLYGESAFEILRVYRGQIFALEEHLGRLTRSAKALGFGLPVAIAQFRVEMERAIAASCERYASIRVIVTRGEGEGGLVPTHTHDATRVVVVEPLRSTPREHYVDGIALATLNVPTRGKLPGETSAAKTGNYVANILALQLAKQAGAQEALLVAVDGRVLEGASSNVFVWTGDALITPEADGAILAGITREHVLDAARDLGIRVQEQRITTSDVWTAEEVFITSSLREVVPVVRIDDHEVGSGVPGEITRRVHAAFRARTPGRGDPMPWV